MRLTIRLSKLHRWSLYFVWLILCVTGLYFAYTQDWQMMDPSDLSVQTLKIHGIFAALMLILVGSLLSTHIKLSLHRKRNLTTGMSLLSLMVILSTTGTGLYYSPEEWHESVKWAHIWIGLISILSLPLHIVIGRYFKK